MSTMVRSCWRVTVVVMAVVGISLAVSPSARGQGTAPGTRQTTPVAVDPPDPNPSGGTGGGDGSGIGGASPSPAWTGFMRTETASPAGSGIETASPADSMSTETALPADSMSTETVSPAVSRGIERQTDGAPQVVSLASVAIGSSTLAATLTTLVLIGLWRNRRPSTDRRPAAGPTAVLAAPRQPEPGWNPPPAERPVRRPVVVKDEPYRARHRFPRR
jgi:hypothetical protein